MRRVRQLDPSELKQQVLSKIDEKKEEMFGFLRDLVYIPSLTGEELKAQQFVEKKFAAMGLEVEVFDTDKELIKEHPAYFEATSETEIGYKNRPNVVGRLPGSSGGKSLILNGHIDCVSIEPKEVWIHDPYSGKIEEGKMYGRGSYDMKSGIAAMTYAVQCLQELGVRLKGDVILETVVSEEDGGMGTLTTILKGYTADAAIVTEPYGVNLIGKATAGVLYFRVKVLGKTAHAAYAHRGVNAIGKMIKIYKALVELNERRQQRIHYEPVESSAPDMKDHATILNIGTIQGGDWPSSAAGWTELECRVGWPPGESMEEVRNQVEEAVKRVTEADPWLKEHPPTIEWFGWATEPSEQDTSHPFVQLITTLTEKLTEKQVRYRGGSAGNDTRFYRWEGCPCVAFGARGGGAHGPNEYVELESIVETSKVLALVLLDWCGYED